MWVHRLRYACPLRERFSRGVVMSYEPDSPGEQSATTPLSPDSVVAQPNFVVGIGASAGGLDPLVRFFDNLPKATGMAFVIVQHLSPDFKSLMDELLGRHTLLPIHLVEDGMPVAADHVYLIPAKKEMIISGGRLLLSERDRQQELTLPIDVFFRSLAQDRGADAIAIVLSGGGSDGSRGIRHVHEAGGLVLAQDLESGQFDGMPKAAFETGGRDYPPPPAGHPADAARARTRSGRRGTGGDRTFRATRPRRRVPRARDRVRH